MACDSTDVLRKMAGFHDQWLMLTLTYREVDGYKPWDLSKVMDQVGKWCARRGVPLRYVWSGELQKRGALHYHVLILVPRSLRLPKPDKRGWWRHGHTRIETVRTNAAGYISKYISKPDEARFPKGCRTHGRSGMTSTQQRWIRYQLMPQWARDRWPDSTQHDLVRPPGGGILERNSGEWMASPWLVFANRSGIWLVANNSTEGRSDEGSQI